MYIVISTPLSCCFFCMTKIPNSFCFELTIVWNLFSGPVFYVSARLVLGRTVWCERKTQRCFCIMLFFLRLAFCVSTKFTNIQIELAMNCSLLGPYLYWIFMNIPKKSQKLFQVSTVSVFLVVYSSVCFIGSSFYFRMFSCAAVRNSVLSSPVTVAAAVYRSLITWKRIWICLAQFFPYFH